MFNIQNGSEEGKMSNTLGTKFNIFVYLKVPGSLVSRFVFHFSRKTKHIHSSRYTMNLSILERRVHLKCCFQHILRHFEGQTTWNDNFRQR